MGDKTLKSSYEALPNSEFKTVPEYLLNKAEFHTQNGKKDWLIDGLTDERRSYKDFNDETGKVASKFFKQGLRKGDFVHYMITDMVKLHLLTNGVWRANGCLRVSYPEDDEETVLKRVREIKSRWLICDLSESKLCLSVASKCEWKILVVVVGTENVPSGSLSFDEYLKDDGSEIPEFQLTEDDTAIILCTSGTTGPSKGAVLTHKAILTSIRLLSRAPFTKNKPNIVISKGVHISGTIFPLAVLASGNTGIVLSKINTTILMEVIHKYKPGSLKAFSGYLLGLCSPEAVGFDFSSLEIIFLGGSPITPAIKTTLTTFLPNVKDFIIIYGLTENLPVSINVDFSDTPGLDPTIRATPDFSVGKLPPGVSIQIRDVETLNILGPHEKGEICIKSDSAFKEYFDDPESTQNTFIDDGWVRSGDQGYYDEDGFLFITDRLKDIFKYYNNHISPTDIESVIGSHSAVNEVCVIGVPDEGGHVPRAFVTLNDHAGEVNNHVQLSLDIKEEVPSKRFVINDNNVQFTSTAKLPTYKQLRGGLYVLNELPKGKTGKVTRRLLGELPLPL